MKPSRQASVVFIPASPGWSHEDRSSTHIIRHFWKHPFFVLKSGAPPLQHSALSLSAAAPGQTVQHTIMDVGYITHSECEWIQDAVVVKLDYELTKGFQKSKFHSTFFPKSKQLPTFLSSIQNPLITPHHFLALLSSSNWGTTVPLATPETSCNVSERRPWRMFHSTRTWRGSTMAWPSSRPVSTGISSNETKRNLDEKMCKLSQSVPLAVNFGKLMPTLLKLPKCILRVAEKLFRHPLKSQAPGGKRRRESIIIMDEDLKPFPGSSTAFYIAFHPTIHGGPINPTCIARQPPNSHHHDPKSAPQRSCHPSRMTVEPKKCEPHGFAKQMSVSVQSRHRLLDVFILIQVSSVLSLHCCWPLLRRIATRDSTQDGNRGYQLLPDYLLQSQSLPQSMLPIPLCAHCTKEQFYQRLHAVTQRHSGVTAIASLVGFIYVGNVLESP